MMCDSKTILDIMEDKMRKNKIIALICALATLVFSGCAPVNIGSSAALNNAGVANTSKENIEDKEEETKVVDTTTEEGKQEETETKYSIPAYAQFYLWVTIDKVDDELETIEEIKLPEKMPLTIDEDSQIVIGTEDDTINLSVKDHGIEGIILLSDKEVIPEDDYLAGKLDKTNEIELAEYGTVIYEGDNKYKIDLMYDYVIDESGESIAFETGKMSSEEFTEDEVLEEVETEEKEMGEKTIVKAFDTSYEEYDELLEKVAVAIENEDASENDEYSYIYGRFGKMESADFGYALIDIDGDNICELVLGENGTIEYPSILYDMYVIQDGKMVHVFSGGERDRYYATDIPNAFIEEASSSANSFMFDTFIVENGRRLSANFYVEPKKRNIYLTPFKE